VLVLVAFVPAAAIAYWAANYWLNSFAYHVDINPLVFIGSGLVAIVVAWVTVSFQSFRAAAANPINSLRQE
jgi:putative ABC transport system permease protein